MPSPSVASIKKQFTDVLMSDNGIYVTTELYCAFSKEKSKTCNTFQTGKYDADPISYARDEYWNKCAVIPSQASVLLLSSKLDAQAPYKHAELLLGALKGNKKELITFEHATHGTILTTPLIPGGPESPHCGMEILVSYIKNGGNLKKMDKSCVKKMPPFNTTITTEYLNGYLLTNEAYDGVYNESLYYQAVGEQSDEQSDES